LQGIVGGLGLGLTGGLAFRRRLAFKFLTILRGIESGIRHGHDGLGVGQKLFDERIEVGNKLGLLWRQVVFFAEILAEIKQQMTMSALIAAVENADELPVATMHRDRWR